MTYCIAIHVHQGLVYCSDSRTNAGIDNVSTYSKMHHFTWPGSRVFTLLSAGNLATTQAVVKRLQQDVQQRALPNLLSVATLQDAADYVGVINTEVQKLQTQRDTQNTNFEASFILGGQIGQAAPEIYMVYPQGNFIHESTDHPFLQIGEVKYGKPILDRVIRLDTDINLAARCALVSMNSTCRSNLTVGPPIDLLIYAKDSLGEGRRLHMAEDDPLARQISELWNQALMRGLEDLPSFPWEQETQGGQVVNFPPPG